MQQMQLEEIDLQDSAVEALPEDLAGAPSLKVLNLSRMQSLRALPEGLGRCPKLETIDLSGSAVEALPQDLAQKQRLL